MASLLAPGLRRYDLGDKQAFTPPDVGTAPWLSLTLGELWIEGAVPYNPQPAVLGRKSRNDWPA